MHEFYKGAARFRLLKKKKPSDFRCTCEIFASTATLSDAFRAKKFSIIAVGKTKERKPKVALECLDLTRPQDVEVLVDVLLNSNLGPLHLAPPGGTSSKGREKPLASNMNHIRAEPLRSGSELLGPKSLNKHAASRVQAANRLYEFFLLCAFIAITRGAIVSLENPSSSYFWAIVALLCGNSRLLREAWNSLEQVHFQACMHGAKRDQWTCWMSTPGVFEG